MRRMRGIAAFAAAVAAIVALAGCAAGGGPAASPEPAVTVTATSTVTATPAPATAAPDDPLGALTAWTACNVLAQSQVPDMTLYPYDPAHPAQRQPDGTWRAIAGYAIEPPVEGAKSVLIICDLKGTRGAGARALDDEGRLTAGVHRPSADTVGWSSCLAARRCGATGCGAVW